MQIRSISSSSVFRKLLIVAISFLSASVALANPFDSFVGNYSIVGAPIIQKSGAASECVRFGFEYLTGFAVIADSKTGYHQTHDLRFNFSGGSIGHGWSGYPAADYYDNVEGGAINFQKTTGDANLAQNESFQGGGQSSEQLIISIQRQGAQYLLTATDTSTDASRTPAVCFYQATLTKQ